MLVWANPRSFEGRHWSHTAAWRLGLWSPRAHVRRPPTGCSGEAERCHQLHWWVPSPGHAKDNEQHPRNPWLAHHLRNWWTKEDHAHSLVAREGSSGHIRCPADSKSICCSLGSLQVSWQSQCWWYVGAEQSCLCWVLRRVHDHVQLTKSQISGRASVVVVPSISAINLTLSPPLIVVQASTSVVSKQNACQVPEFQALWKCIGKVSGKFGPLHDIWVWSTNSGGGCLVHGRDWHIEEFHWHHHQSKDSTFLPSFDGWKSVIQLQASFSVGWSHHKSFPVTRWSLHSDLVHIQHTSTDQFHERLFRLVHWERIRLSRSQLNVLPRPSGDDPFRWHSHRTAWRIWQLHDDVVFRMPLWNTCRIASGKLGLGTHIFAPLMEVSFSLKGDVHLATDADILRAGIQLWNSCNWNHQCDQPPHHVSRGWLGRKGGNRGWSSLHFWSQTSNAYLWRKRKQIENNIWPVHARAQNLHFGVQHCRSHANKLLLKFLNKHVMICDDIVALKPWFYDDILQSDTNIHHSRTASLPAQARFLDPVGRLKQHSKRPTSRDGDFTSLQDGAEVRSTTALPFLDVSSGFQLLRCRQQLLPCTTEA